MSSTITSSTLEDVVLQHEISRFLFAEARLIDDREFHTWLELFTEDTRYLLPIRRNSVDDEFTDPLSRFELAHFDDTKAVLSRRVMRMSSPSAWTEDPPSIQRHLITNIEVDRMDNGEFEVRSCFQAHRYRLDRDVEVFTGNRCDVLRRDERNPLGFSIAARTVYLDHTTLLANNLNIFL
ncbi:MAG TPA: aromatic-ring-hydroxylating dioxygenase subunit beta [Pseudonocardia sp.]|jgi:biphenyl 2,3-dioxygenase beta subunit|nr:aromatic-ring-hydroxylating dioxygenase subunit beta [Pseudonocardia sp.]